jgi:hypothetical protein
MNPSEAPLPEVGNGGDDEVSVVAKRVGENRLEDGCTGDSMIRHKLRPDEEIALFAAISNHNRVDLPTLPSGYLRDSQ